MKIKYDDIWYSKFFLMNEKGDGERRIELTEVGNGDSGVESK